MRNYLNAGRRYNQLDPPYSTPATVVAQAIKLARVPVVCIVA
jgi:hypothetical protein